jgi:hypothetical protein
VEKGVEKGDRLITPTSCGSIRYWIGNRPFNSSCRFSITSTTARLPLFPRHIQSSFHPLGRIGTSITQPNPHKAYVWKAFAIIDHLPSSLMRVWKSV